jgi:hypothetical protein
MNERLPESLREIIRKRVGDAIAQWFFAAEEMRVVNTTQFDHRLDSGRRRRFNLLGRFVNYTCGCYEPETHVVSDVNWTDSFNGQYTATVDLMLVDHIIEEVRQSITSRNGDLVDWLPKMMMTVALRYQQGRYANAAGLMLATDSVNCAVNRLFEAEFRLKLTNGASNRSVHHPGNAATVDVMTRLGAGLLG